MHEEDLDDYEYIQNSYLDYDINEDRLGYSGAEYYEAESNLDEYPLISACIFGDYVEVDDFLPCLYKLKYYNEFVDYKCYYDSVKKISIKELYQLDVRLLVLYARYCVDRYGFFNWWWYVKKNKKTMEFVLLNIDRLNLSEKDNNLLNTIKYAKDNINLIL